MGKAFELTYEHETDATPDEVWDAIATGPGLDAWFMGRNEVEPREGGKTRLEISGFGDEATIKVWQPPTRLVTEGAEGPDGSHHSFDYRVEPRGNKTAVRWTHTGFLGSDNWELEYEGMGEGDPIYFAKLFEYLEHFRGRRATPVNVFHPGPADKDEGWTRFREALGLEREVSVGDRVTLTPAGLPPIEGEVDVRSTTFLGVRSDDAMVRFMHVDWNRMVGLGHHLFAEDVPEDIEQRWATWLADVFPVE
jgi:uncharacterized protein YndB with AHSA1/START domain